MKLPSEEMVALDSQAPLPRAQGPLEQLFPSSGTCTRIVFSLAHGK